MRAEAERLPVAARESADAMRTALNDQLRALEQLSSLSARERRDVTPPARCRMPPQQPQHACRSRPPTPQQRSAHLPAASRWGRAGDDGERWSLGDLLARASRDEDGTQRAPIINIESIARALDPTTASAIWSRFRAGQRGIMVRSIYTTEGRATFDEVSERYKTDVDFHRMVDRFLARLRVAAARHRAEGPLGPRRARPPDLRQRPRLSVPRPRQRTAALRGAPLAMARSHPCPARRSKLPSRPGRSPARSPSARGAKREAAVVVARVSDGTRHRARRMRALCALRRDGRERARGHPRRAATLSDRADLARRSCRPAPPATRSTARCGTTRPSAPATAPQRSPACAPLRAAHHRLHHQPRHCRRDGRQGRRRGRARMPLLKLKLGGARRCRAPAPGARRLPGRAPDRRRQRGLDAGACCPS